MVPGRPPENPRKLRVVEAEARLEAVKARHRRGESQRRGRGELLPAAPGHRSCFLRGPGDAKSHACSLLLRSALAPSGRRACRGTARPDDYNAEAGKRSGRWGEPAGQHRHHHHHHHHGPQAVGPILLPAVPGDHPPDCRWRAVSGVGESSARTGAFLQGCRRH